MKEISSEVALKQIGKDPIKYSQKTHFTNRVHTFGNEVKINEIKIKCLC